MMNKTLETYDELSTLQEDAPVIAFLEKLPIHGRSLSYLEAGSGLARFPLLLRDRLHMDHIDITCLDISADLVSKLKSLGFAAICAPAKTMPFPDSIFDVVHCSHMIEHLGYPEIVETLDELVRVTKPDGYLIIRSPLMHPGFWNNIDHIRPYPPKTLMLYFRHEQQQRVSPYKIELVGEWTRRGAWSLPWRMSGAGYVNACLMSLWNRFGFPHSRPTGYVAIFKKKA